MKTDHVNFIFTHISLQNAPTKMAISEIYGAPKGTW